mmetsp:Transcript_5689/g.13193  ORF Transcript_5689/g.13193 Transcript_5689/m.13193 type:complete len:235 (-) Transcript_5689:1210-1914(-)
MFSPRSSLRRRASYRSGWRFDASCLSDPSGASSSSTLGLGAGSASGPSSTVMDPPPIIVAPKEGDGVISTSRADGAGVPPGAEAPAPPSPAPPPPFAPFAALVRTVYTRPPVPAASSKLKLLRALEGMYRSPAPARLDAGLEQADPAYDPAYDPPPTDSHGDSGLGYPPFPLAMPAVATCPRSPDMGDVTPVTMPRRRGLEDMNVDAVRVDTVDDDVCEVYALAALLAGESRCL